MILLQNLILGADSLTPVISLKANTTGVVFENHLLIDSVDFKGPDSDDFADICLELSFEQSSYNFATIPVHILGSIYERFLGNIIVLKDKSVTIEPKLEVRKAGGVYYTPQYIVKILLITQLGI